MKKHNNLFDQIAGFDNLLKAARKAQKGKRFRKSTAMFNLNLERNLLTLHKELTTQNYCHGGYKDFIVHDPKKRLISAAPYPDRVIHHALCNVIEPIFDKTFIDDSFACRTGKGTHAAVDRYTVFCRKNKYVLKCDIRKYFQSVDHEILFSLISRKIKCQKTLWLLRSIIDTRCDRSFIAYFAGDDLFTPFIRNKGIPIGNLTSQFFANVYLNGFDHYIKEQLKCRHYIRYVDDFVVFHNEKVFLHEAKSCIKEYLGSLRLRLHPEKSRIFRVRDGVEFLGYRVFPTHRLLKKENALLMRRKMKKMSLQYQNGMIALQDVQQRIQSWIGHASHADTHTLRTRILASVAFQRGETESDSRRRVEQRSEQRALCQPQQEQSEQPEQQPRISLRQDLNFE